jgi:hypothetical protein
MSCLGPAMKTARCGSFGLLSETGLTLSRLDFLTSVDEDQLWRHISDKQFRTDRQVRRQITFQYIPCHSTSARKRPRWL